MIQSIKNRRFHRGIGRSPFEAMFGRKMVFGRENETIPTNEERNIKDIENEAFEGEKFDDWSESILAANTDNPPYYPELDAKEHNSDHEAVVLTQRNEEIEQHRKRAVECQQKQAEKMLKKAQNRFGPVDIETTVRLPIDATDRLKIGNLFLLGVMMSTDDGFYQIDTKNGVLKQKLTRNQFEPGNNNFISTDEVPPQETSFRAAGPNHCRGLKGISTVTAQVVV